MKKQTKEQLKDIVYILPNEIEKESFRIIEEGLEGKVLDELQAPIIKRAIHTSADFDYVDNLCFSEEVVEKVIAALKQGVDIVTDTQMAKAGINKRTLEKFNGQVHCFISDEDVANRAKEEGITRSAAAIDKALGLDRPLIFAIGNAPTALLRLYERIEEGTAHPVLVIGVPVGFVNVVESKEYIMTSKVPYIVARGRKGGSNIAAAICNALLYMADERKL